MLKLNFGDLVAANMDTIVQSEEHNNFFNKSSSEKCCECKDCKKDCNCEKCHSDCNACVMYSNSHQQVFNILLGSSNKLDKLGMTKIATDILNVLDEMDANEASNLSQELRNFSEKYPEMKSSINEFLEELSSEEEPLEFELDNPESSETMFEVTEAPPSIMAEELPIIPKPSNTKSIYQDLYKNFGDVLSDEFSQKEIESLMKEIDTKQYNPHASDEKTIRPGFSSEIKASFERLNQWILKHADVLNEDDEEFEDEDEE